MQVARLLDLTRLVSRLGRGPLTGVDRVEFAYLTYLLSQETLLFALVRTRVGFLLLGREGAAALHRAVLEGASPPLGALARLLYRRNPARAAAERFVRRYAIGRAPRALLARMLRRHVPQGCHVVNVGHANLSDHVLRTYHAALAAKIMVLVHDTIPLDHPDFTRASTVDGFRAKMQAVAQHADLVLFTTQDARGKAEAHFARFGRVPAARVVPLGVPVATPDQRALPAGLPPTTPYFVVLGTIEPRKNHALLLDVWQRLEAQGGAVPKLLIVGGRGWENHETFARLDAQPHNGPVQELPGLSDSAVAALLADAQALLFPSLVEGFGLPPMEAASLGTPVISSNLAVIQELLGDFPVYLNPQDSYSWMETILHVLQNPSAERPPKVRPPSWQEHFLKVFGADWAKCV